MDKNKSLRFYYHKFGPKTSRWTRSKNKKAFKSFLKWLELLTTVAYVDEDTDIELDLMAQLQNSMATSMHVTWRNLYGLNGNIGNGY